MLRHTCICSNVYDPVFMRNVKKALGRYREAVKLNGHSTKTPMSNEAFIDIDDKGPAWYMGHMGLAASELARKVKDVDFVLEMRDARLPFSTENPNLRKLLNGKPRLIFFNKAELANEDVNLAIQKYYDSMGDFAMFTSTHRAYRDVVEAVQKFAVHVLPSQQYQTVAHVGAVIGMPNVGKSTLINTLRLSHEYQFRREDFLRSRTPQEVNSMSGTTRHNTMVPVCRDPNVVLYDTPGMTLPGNFSKEAGFKLAACGIIPTNDMSVPTHLVARYVYDIMVASGAMEHMAECLHLPRTPVTFDDCCTLIAERSGRTAHSAMGMELLGVTYNYILEDFRSGHLGRITLDRLPTRVRRHLSQTAAAGEEDVVGHLGTGGDDASGGEDDDGEDDNVESGQVSRPRRRGGHGSIDEDGEFTWTHHVESHDVVSRYPEHLRDVLEEIDGLPRTGRRSTGDNNSNSNRGAHASRNTDRQGAPLHQDSQVISRIRGPISRVTPLKSSYETNTKLRPNR